MPPSKDDSSITAATQHSDVTLDLAKKESAEHMEGMDVCLNRMRSKPLRFKAYNIGNCASVSDENEVRSYKTVHFVRHGQGFHNLMADIATGSGLEWRQFDSSDPNNPYIREELLDSPLTEKGRLQAIMLQPEIREMKNQPQLVVSSPNCRALQTAAIAFDHLIGHESVQFLSHEMAREETGIHMCDKRRSASRQGKEFPMFDFSLLETDEDVIFQADRRETKLEVGERVYKFLEWLHGRTERHIAVASHSGWLMTVFNGVVETDDECLKAWFQTGEMRSVRIEFETSA